jgi:hypothetical protein
LVIRRNVQGNTQRSSSEIDTRKVEREIRPKQRRNHITLNPTNLYRYMKLRAYVINNYSSKTEPAQNGSNHERIDDYINHEKMNQCHDDQLVSLENNLDL